MIIAVVSDIHSNLAAFEAVLAHLPPVDDLWCLGDTVGYGPHPNECIELLESRHPSVVLAGNHDWAAIDRLDIGAFNSDAAQAALWTGRQLTAHSRTFLENLPTLRRVGDWTLVHGSPRQPVWEYVLDCADAQANFKHFETRYCLVGHSHVAAIFVEGFNQSGELSCFSKPAVVAEKVALGPDRLIVNPGSVGQPRDGDPSACYLLLDTARATIEFRRVAYDVQRTQQDMKKVGLPSRLWHRLSYGL